MSTTRGRRQLAGGFSAGTATAAARRNMGTQSPSGGTGGPSGQSMRIPRATGLVGVGVGPSQPVTYAVGGPGYSHPLLDLSSVISWRIIFGLAAVAYIVGWHVTLPGVGRIGFPRGLR